MSATEIATVNPDTLSEIDSAVMSIDAIVVKNDDDAQVATDWIKKLSVAKKKVKEEKDAFVAPAKLIVEKAKSLYDPLTDKLDKAERTLRSKTQTYLMDKENLRKKEEERIAKATESGRMKQETAIRKMEGLGDVKKSVKTASGSSLSLRKTKDIQIVDEDKIPDEYWVVDTVRLKKVALALAPEDQSKWGSVIPGIKIIEVVNTSLN